MILYSYFHHVYRELKADNLDKDTELRLAKYLLKFKLNKELRDFCKVNNLRSSGNKIQLIETIIESSSIRKILLFTLDIRLLGSGIHIDSDILEIRKEIGENTFDNIIHLAPLRVPEVLVIASLRSGPKTRSEIFSDPYFIKYLQLVSKKPEVQRRLGKNILRDVRKSLVSTGILSLKPGVWEYSINLNSMDYLKEIEILEADELYHRVAHKRNKGIIPAELFHVSPGALAVYTGKLGEELTGRYLSENGYEVCKFPDDTRFRKKYLPNDMELGLCPHIKCKKAISEVKEICQDLDSYLIKQCFGIDPNKPERIIEQAPCPCTFVFPKLCENCVQLGICPIHETFKLLGIKEVDFKDIKYHAPDFIAHKDGKNYLVEVKTNRKRDHIIQSEFLNHMKSFGLNTILAYVTIPFNQIKDEIEIII